MELDSELGGSIELIFKTIVQHLPKVLFFLILMIFIHFLVKVFVRRLEDYFINEMKKRSKKPAEFEKRINTIVMIFNKFIFILLWIFGVIVFLGTLGISTSPFLAIFGVFGLALGFGAQNLISDIISGIFILIENQIRVGDVAVINGTGGVVESINLRTIVLRDLMGIVHVFPNGSIETLANRTKEWSAFVFDLGVAYRENIDWVMEVIQQVGEELQLDPEWGPMVLEPLEIFGLDQFGDSAIIIKGRIKTEPGMQWKVGREFNRRIKKTFDALAIEIPFPHTSLYMGAETKPLEILFKREGRREKDAFDS